MSLEVRLGAKGEKGKELDEADHSIRIETLREGKTKYWVKGDDDKMFLVDLAVSEDEIRAFASGTALVVDAIPAKKAESNDDDAVEGWVAMSPAPDGEPLVVTLQLKQTAERRNAPRTPRAGGGGGW